FEIYDQYALNAIKLASPFPPVPPAVMAWAPQGSTGIPIRVNFTYQLEPGITRLPRGASPQAAEVHAPTQAAVITVLEGSVTARRPTLPDPVPLKFKDVVFFSDIITTGDNSRVRMLLGGKCVVAMRERSVLTLSEEARRAWLELQSGQITASVAQERMRPG